MDWHYAKDGQQMGPVTLAELVQLAERDVIKPETLVWRPGMAEWLPFDVAGPGAAGSLAPEEDAPEEADVPHEMCAACGRSVPSQKLVVTGGAAICGECRPASVPGCSMMPVPPPLRYAGFWIRVAAQLIDGILLNVVMSAAFFGLYGNTFFDSVEKVVRAGPQADPAALLPSLLAAAGTINLTFFALQMAYSVFFWVRFGATPGKMAVGIKVVTSAGGPITLGQGVGRYFATVLSSLLLGVGHMMAGWDGEKRALHDRIAGTRVIRSR